MVQKPSPYPPLDGLLDLACRDGVDIRPTLLRVLTDLYVQKPTHTANEETQYVELALGLIHSVDDATREAVKASLRDYPAVPPAIQRALCITMPPATSAMAANPAPSPERAPAAKAESAPPRQRADDLIDLFFGATPDERRLILTNLDVMDTRDDQLPQAAAIETVDALEAAAMRRDAQAFSQTLARSLGLEAGLADRIVADVSGEPIVVVARGLGMKAAVLQRVLLFLNPDIGQSIERVYDLSRLFDEMSPRAAAQMLAIWRKPDTRKKPVHEPVLYDDERRGARAASTPGRHAAPAREVPSHLKKSRR